MALPVLLSPRLAAATRDLLVADTAVDSVVYDLALDPDAGPFDADGRYVGVYRAPAGTPGDFVVLGGFADPDVANFALLNRNAMTADDLVAVDETVDALFAKYLEEHPVPPFRGFGS